MTEKEIDSLIESRIHDLEEYNGWSNYETWCVAKWLVQYDSYTMIRQWCKEKNMSKPELTEKIKHYVTSANPLKKEPGMYCCLIEGAIGRVNWIEIIDHITEGILGEESSDYPI